VVRIYDVNDLLVVTQDCFSSIIRVSRRLSSGESPASRERCAQERDLHSKNNDRPVPFRVLPDRAFYSAVEEAARTCASRARQKHTNKIVTRINTSSKNIDIDSDKDAQRIALRYDFSTIVLVKCTVRRDDPNQRGSHGRRSANENG
jgi:hypothetical protein